MIDIVVRNQKIGLVIIVLLGATSVAIGQTRTSRPTLPNHGNTTTLPANSYLIGNGSSDPHYFDGRQPVGSFIFPLTPRQKAAHREVADLDREAAEAFDVGQYGEAEADTRKALSMGQDSGMGGQILAEALDAQGKTDEALAAYQMLVNQGCDDTGSLLRYSLLLLKTGHWAHAVAVYHRIRTPSGGGMWERSNGLFSPDVPQPRQLATAIHISLGINYGWLYSWGGHAQTDKAMAEFHQALALTPNSAMAYLYYGDALWHVGHHRAQALAAYHKAATLGRGDVKAAAEKKLGVDTSGRS
jgi:tetratricopeptide (TPR) repeat protein